MFNDEPALAYATYLLGELRSCGAKVDTLSEAAKAATE